MVVAALNREPLIKTLQRNADGQYELHSANRRYKPIPVREEDESESKASVRRYLEEVPPHT
ncbi:S24 family peptidase [Pseudomonas oryzihabitans]|uniref:S24 family peptidase n=1 Tax=Pseudomonas oryzihabitans TaxID=47885 RepID=UPI00286D4ACF|nr:S24 family peptidase [Pseudomonas psychrotolerans]